MSVEILRQYLKPWGRALKYGTLKRRADRLVAGMEAEPVAVPGAVNGHIDSFAAPASKPRSAFLIGCGRSGTTVVGEILSWHQDVSYFFEPYHLWATVDPRIDVLNLYCEGPSRLLLDQDDATPSAKRRFDALLMQRARKQGTDLVIEKTPFNACRIGYLEALRPGSKYVHLVRDGVDVARSIARLSRDRSYSIAGKPALNRWWGLKGCKWSALALDGKASGYFADEVPLLRSDESKGAYEWIVSLKEIDRWRDRLGDHLLEIGYEQLTSQPRESLKRICEFLEIAIQPRWFERAAGTIDKPRRNKGEPLVLPPAMCAEFNAQQERFGFHERAEPGEPHASKVRVVFVSNEPTPYRLHVLNRLLNELPEARVESIFTHTISKPTMPWEMTIDARLNPVFFPDAHLRRNRPISLRSVPLFLRIRRYLRKTDVQLAIVLGYNDLTRLLTITACNREGVPVLLSADSNIFGDARTSGMVRIFKRPVVRFVLKRLAGLMPMGTCGRAFYRHYLNHGLPEFLFPYEPDYAALQLRNDSEIERFREKHGLPESRHRLLYCGRLVKVKRVDLLIQAFCAMAPRRPDWDLVIAGGGPLAGQLRGLVPPNLNHRIIWLGFTQFNDVKLAYQCCDVLVHPSAHEPWGLVINEAVACDLPVIATSVTGAAVELIRHGSNGLLVEPGSADALANAMLEITDGERWLEMKKYCKPMLEAWQRAADPVEGIRKALQFFGILGEQPSASDNMVPASQAPWNSVEEPAAAAAARG